MISAEDFNLLQEQLIELKRYKYETSEREKKYQNEIKQLKDQVDHHEEQQLSTPNTPKKKSSLFSDVLTNITKDKGKLTDLQEENEILKKTIQQNTLVHQEQSEALQHNVKSLFETNSKLEDDIKSLNKEIKSYNSKIEEQQSTIRKLQFDIAESISNSHNQSFDSSCSTPNSSNNSSSNNYNNIDELINIINEIETISKEDKDELKSKFLSIHSNSTTPPSTNTPNTPTLTNTNTNAGKEIIFHPLGEPEYNPDDEKEKNKLRDTIKSLMEQIKEQEVKYRQLQTSLKEQEQQIEDSNQSTTQWQDKHKQAEINRVKIEDKLGNEIKSLKDDIQKLQLEGEQSQSTQKKLNDTIGQLQLSLKLDNENFEKAIHDKIDELKNQKLNYERQLADLNDKSNIFKMSRDEYLDQFNKSTKEISEKDQELESLKSKISNLERDNSILSESLKSLEEDFNNTKESLDSSSLKSKKFEDKLAMERSSFDSLTDKFNLLNSEHLELEKKSKDMEKEFQENQKSLESLTKDHQDQSNEFENLKTSYQSQQSELEELKEKLSKLESQISESSEKLLVLEEMTNQNLILKSELEEKSNTLKETSEELLNLKPEFEKIKSSWDESCKEIVKLKVQMEDAETDKRIAEKKNLKMIKDLKLELSKERESLSQSASNITTLAPNHKGPHLSTSSSSLPSSPAMLSKSASSVSLPTTPNIIPMKLPQNPKGHHQRSHSMNPNHLINQPPVNMDQLKHDFELMGRKLGEIGNEKYQLEEKVRSLESNLTNLNQELDKKTKVVRFYISKTQLGRATTEDEKTKRLKGGILGSFWRNNDPKVVAEMVEKMETMLQENILKNIQLSDDIETLGDESIKLKNENQRLKELLNENNNNNNIKQNDDLK